MNNFLRASLLGLNRNYQKRIISRSNRGFCGFGMGVGGQNEAAETDTWKSMVRCSANCSPLTPITFLERSAKVYRDRPSLVYGSLNYTWTQTHQRCLKLASALTQLGISKGHVVGISLSLSSPKLNGCFFIFFNWIFIHTCLCFSFLGDPDYTTLPLPYMLHLILQTGHSIHSLFLFLFSWFSFSSSLKSTVNLVFFCEKSWSMFYSVGYFIYPKPTFMIAIIDYVNHTGCNSGP